MGIKQHQTPAVLVNSAAEMLNFDDLYLQYDILWLLMVHLCFNNMFDSVVVEDVMAGRANNYMVMTI